MYSAFNKPKPKLGGAWGLLVSASTDEASDRFDTDWNWYRAEFVLDNVKKAYDAYLADAKKV